MHDEDKLLPTSEQTEIAEAKQYFYKYFAKPEYISKVFEGSYQFNLEQIESLNNRVSEKLGMYKNAGFLVSVSVKLKNKKMLEFNTFDSFKTYDWSSEYETESVNIQWTFNAILPNYGTPMKHVIAVTLTRGMKPEELMRLIFSGNLEENRTLDIAPYPIYASITFINKILADEILEIITKWSKTYNNEGVHHNSIFEKIYRYRQMVAVAIEYFITIILMISSSFYFVKNILAIQETKLGDIPVSVFTKDLIYFLAVIGVFSMANRFAKFVAQFAFNSINKFKSKSCFKLTKMDETYVDKLQNKSKNSTLNLVLSLIGMIASGFVGKIIDLIFELVFKIIGG